MIKWLGENGGALVGTNKYLCMQKKDLCVQIRFLCRLYRGCFSRGSRTLWCFWKSVRGSHHTCVVIGRRLLCSYFTPYLGSLHFMAASNKNLMGAPTYRAQHKLLI
jgi:hypothetical protein